MCKLSLVVPCYNEELNVKYFHDSVRKIFKDRIKEYEIIFVNDGSKDNTYGKLCEIVNSTDVAVRVINFSRNFGKEAAILAGLKESKGSYVSIIDADMQQDPNVVLKMIDILDNKPDVDCVAAFQETRHESKSLIFFKNSFYKIINKMSEVKFTQGASDFRTCRRSVVETIISLKEYHRFSKGIFSWVGYKTEYIPYEVNPRHEGKSTWSFVKLFKYAIDGITAYSVMPLKIPVYVGLATCLSSLLCIIVALFRYILYSQSLTFGQILIFIALLMFGIQFIFIGILGEYVSKNYIQSKDRPIYIIKDKINNIKDVHYD